MVPFFFYFLPQKVITVLVIVLESDDLFSYTLPSPLAPSPPQSAFLRDRLSSVFFL